MAVKNRTQLKEFGSVLRGVTFNPEKDFRPFGSEQSIELLRSNNIQENVLVLENTYNLNIDRVKNSQILINGDILICMANGSKELVGKSAFVPEKVSGRYTFGSFMGAFRPHNQEQGEFLQYVFQTTAFRDHINLILAGSSINNLTPTLIEEFVFDVPNIDEQKAIAGALSDLDDFILLIKKEIDKKQNMKLAISENLFSKVYSEIVHLRLRDIGFFYGGLSGKSGQDFRKGNSKYITFLNVINNVIADPNMIETVDIKSNEKQNLVLEGDLLFNGSSETPEEVAFPSLVPSALNGFYLNSFCFGFRFEKTDSLDPLFFAHYLRSRFGRQFVSQLAQGSTRYNISKNALYDLVWNLPTLRTQIEIGKILSDLDSDLSELKKEKSKYEWIKKGMMSDLLTGKVRLV